MNDDFDFDKTLRAFYPGQQVFNRYTLVRQLGRGGMGLVWLADDKQLEQQVALKFLPEVIASDAAAIDDLKRETRKALQLTHPNIVRIYDFLQDNQLVAVSMEYIDGSNLTQLRVEEEHRAFNCNDIKPWIEQICRALDYAHNKAQIAHRDLKPSNILLTGNGEIKITDFGISATISDSTTASTMLNSSSGTPVYMSPQQMMGEKADQSDDVYSLGVTIYELLTSKPPFYSGNIVLQVQHKMAPSMKGRRRELGIVGLEDIPEAWESTVRACLSKDTADRPKGIINIPKCLQNFHCASSYDDPERLMDAMKTGTDDESSKKKKKFPLWMIILVLVCGSATWFFAGTKPSKLSYLESMEIVNHSLNVWNDIGNQNSISELSRVIVENETLPEVQALAYAYRAIVKKELGLEFETDLIAARGICMKITGGSIDAEYSPTINEINGIISYLHSDYDLAAYYLTKALNFSSLTDDHRASILGIRATVYFLNPDKDHPDKALEDINEALKLKLSTDSYKFHLYMRRGWMYGELDQDSKSIDNYTYCLSLNISPDEKSQALGSRAYLWTNDKIGNRLNDWDAIINMPGVSRWYRLNAMLEKALSIYLDLNETTTAIPLLTQVIESSKATNNQKAEAYFWRAHIRNFEGQLKEAKSDLEAGLSLKDLPVHKRILLQDKLDSLNK